MTQMRLTAGDEIEAADSNTALFPAGATDVNGQQVDQRKQNSWTMKLHEVSTPELAEVQTVELPPHHRLHFHDYHHLFN
jgi:hypothetical protein